MKRYLLLCVIIGVAFFLRIYKVGSIPPALSWDEVSIGYNAYSILKTGFDEHHRFLPLDAFVAYGDYKPPLSIYLTIPFVAIFGLTEIAVRLPSVIAGTMTVLVTYFLIAELFTSSISFRKIKDSYLPLLVSLLLAISPWHIQLSRAGFEANIAVFLIALGVLLTLCVRRHPGYLIFCFVPFTLTIYTFNSARFFTPLLVFGLIVYLWKYMYRSKKEFFLGCVICGILLMPITPHLLSKEARLRFAEVNIFTDLSVIQTANDRISFDGNTWWSAMLHNRRIGYAKSYLLHFFDNLEPWFLFIRGDGNPKFSLGDVGQLYLMELPFLVFGILWMLRDHKGTAWLLIYWLVASIAPAATARETPHALRIENSLPVWQIFIAFAIASSINHQSSRRKLLFVIGIVVLYLGSFLYFWHNYLNHYATEYSGEWQWGYREAIREIQPIKHNYDEIVMSEIIGRPYMYVLFYEKVDPQSAWQKIRGTFDAAGFYNVHSLDTYRFVRSGSEIKSKTLYILPPDNVPDNAHIVSRIRRLNGEPILVIFDI